MYVEIKQAMKHVCRNRTVVLKQFKTCMYKPSNTSNKYVKTGKLMYVKTVKPAPHFRTWYEYRKGNAINV